jgi:hypothetical protein
MSIVSALGGFMAIERASQLPTKESSVEGRSIDFKREHKSTRLECAKDVAAFANTNGGTILIGAQGKGDRLETYLPLVDGDAQAAKRDYEEAIRDRCRPAPIFDVAFIARDAGVIVAVNVWPMPGQPVGVELLKKDLADYEREFEGTYFYPLRVGSQTRSILPEQMPMFIDAKSRKAAILLSRAVGSAIVMCVPKYEKNRFWRDELKLLAVDIQANCLALELDGKYRVAVPLDMVEAAWFEGSRAFIAVSGYIDRYDTSSKESEPEETGGYFFMPLPRIVSIDDLTGRD